MKRRTNWKEADPLPNRIELKIGNDLLQVWPAGDERGVIVQLLYGKRALQITPLTTSTIHIAAVVRRRPKP